MESKKELDLEPIITGLCYRKNETLTETEIRQSINEAMLNFGVEYVTTLPTGNNIREKVYIVPDTTQSTGNFGDIYVYDKTNQKWIHIDGLKFNIDDYSKINDIKDNLISTDTNKPLSANQGRILNNDKISSAGTGLSKSGTTLNHSNNIPAQTNAVFKKIKYDQQGHVTGTENVIANDLPSHEHGINDITNLQSNLNNKVDKVNGKGLSTEDFTADEKNKLDGIETGANKTIIEDNLSSGSSTRALAARQGWVLSERLTEIESEHVVTQNDILQNVGPGLTGAVSSDAVYRYVDGMMGDIHDIIYGTGG